MTAARLQLAGGDPDAAIETLAQARASGAVGVHTVADLEHIVLEAIAQDTAGAPGRASEAIERALAHAERTGHRWTFVEGGRRIEGLLRARIRQGTAHRAVAGELLAAFEERDCERRTVAPLLEPLSERECAILRYLPDDALQPRDRGRAVRDHEHGQDAPAQHLPQARRRSPA